MNIVDKFIRTDEDLILLGSYRGYEGNSRYLYEKLIQDGEMECVWVAHTEDTVTRLESMGLPVVNAWSLHGLYTLLKANVVVINHNYTDVAIHPSFVPDSIISVFISHGARLPMERHLPDQTTDNPELKYDYYICYSDLHRKFSIWLDGQTGKTSLDSVPGSITESFQVTGSPKTDLLFEPTENMKEKWDTFIGDQNPENVVLYAPVKGYLDQLDHLNQPIKEFFPFSDFSIEQLHSYLEKNNTLLLLRPHPQNIEDIAKYDSGPFRLLENHLHDLCQGSEWIRLATHREMSTIELLPFIDTLVTDWSTIYFEYLPLNRPIVFLGQDCHSELERPTFKFDFESFKPGPSVTSQVELLEELDKTLSGTDGYRAERERIRNEFYAFSDSKATERVTALLKKIIYGAGDQSDHNSESDKT